MRDLQLTLGSRLLAKSRLRCGHSLLSSFQVQTETGMEAIHVSRHRQLSTGASIQDHPVAAPCANTLLYALCSPTLRSERLPLCAHRSAPPTPIFAPQGGWTSKARACLLCPPGSHQSHRSRPPPERSAQTSTAQALAKISFGKSKVATDSVSPQQLNLFAKSQPDSWILRINGNTHRNVLTTTVDSKCHRFSWLDLTSSQDSRKATQSRVLWHLTSKNIKTHLRS